MYPALDVPVLSSLPQFAPVYGWWTRTGLSRSGGGTSFPRSTSVEIRELVEVDPSQDVANPPNSQRVVRAPFRSEFPGLGHNGWSVKPLSGSRPRGRRVRVRDPSNVSFLIQTPGGVLTRSDTRLTFGTVSFQESTHHFPSRPFRRGPTGGWSRVTSLPHWGDGSFVCVKVVTVSKDAKHYPRTKGLRNTRTSLPMDHGRTEKSRGETVEV